MKRFLKNFKKILSKDYSIIGCFIVFFAIFLFNTSAGLGQFWDWSIPYYPDKMTNLFQVKSGSWSEDALGSPLGYSSDYYLRFALSLSPLNPETTMYLCFVLIFAIGTFFIYKILTKLKLNRWFINIPLALCTFINPAIFYKLLSGHYLTIFSLFVVIAGIYYLLFRFKERTLDYIALGLLFSFVGFQLQYFIFFGVFLLVYFLYFIPKKKWRLLWLIIIPLLINSVWLYNFATGVNSVRDFSSNASTISFNASKFSGIIEVLGLFFSKATMIAASYPHWVIVVFLGFTFLALSGMFSHNKYIKIRGVIIINYFFSAIIASGIFWAIEIPGLSLFYPILRESGHISPLLIVYLILLIGLRPLSQKPLKYVGLVILILFFLINTYIFQTKLPILNYAEVRADFSSVKEFLDNDDATYRVITFPFFNQYGFVSGEQHKSGYILNNSGQDSFTAFNGNAYVNNSVPSDKLKDSVQGKFLISKDIALLSNTNVKYILNLPSIYKSNLSNYIDKKDYGGDLKTNNEDQYFISSYAEENSNLLTKVTSDNTVYRVNTYAPRLDASGLKFARISTSMYKFEINVDNAQADLLFLSNYHSGWQLYFPATAKLSCTNVIDETTTVKECTTDENITSAMLQILSTNKNQVSVEHIKLNNWANEYTLSNIQTDNTIVGYLYFMPEAGFWAIRILSVGTILSCLIYIIFPKKESD